MKPREGELLALKGEYLDLEAGTLRVWRTLTYADSKHSPAEPKTKKSQPLTVVSHHGRDSLPPGPPGAPDGEKMGPA